MVSSLLLLVLLLFSCSLVPASSSSSSEKYDKDDDHEASALHVAVVVLCCAFPKVVHWIVVVVVVWKWFLTCVRVQCGSDWWVLDVAVFGNHQPQEQCPCGGVIHHDVLPCHVDTTTVHPHVSWLSHIPTEHHCPSDSGFTHEQWSAWLSQFLPHCLLAPIVTPSQLQLWKFLAGDQTTPIAVGLRKRYDWQAHACQQAVLSGTADAELIAKLCQEGWITSSTGRRLASDDDTAALLWQTGEPNGSSETDNGLLAVVAALQAAGGLIDASLSDTWTHAAVECCITKNECFHLPPPPVDSGRRRITVFVYEDTNGNFVFDGSTNSDDRAFPQEITVELVALDTPTQEIQATVIPANQGYADLGEFPVNQRYILNVVASDETLDQYQLATSGDTTGTLQTDPTTNEQGITTGEFVLTEHRQEIVGWFEPRRFQGTLQDTNQNPVPGRSVATWADGITIRQGRIGTSGEFDIALPPGTSLVEFFATDGSNAKIGTKSVTLTPGQVLEQEDVTIVPASLQGQVVQLTDSGEDGIDGVTVDLFNLGGQYMVGTTTFGQGQFQIMDPLPPSKYIVVLTGLPGNLRPVGDTLSLFRSKDDKGDGTLTSRFITLDAGVNQQLDIVVTGDGDVTDLAVELMRTVFRVEGVVLVDETEGDGTTDGGLGGVSVTLVDSTNEDTNWMATTDANGEFLFDAVPHGEYSVTIDQTGFEFGDNLQQAISVEDQDVTTTPAVLINRIE